MRKADLLEALNITKSCLHPQNYIPILTHFWFDGQSVTTYNNEQAVSVNLESDLNCTVLGKPFLQVVNTISKEEIKITASEEEVIIKHGRNRSKIPAMSSDDIYTKPDISNCASLSLDKDFIKGLKLCMISVNKEGPTAAEKGITFSLGKESYLYTTNNDTISRYKLDKKILDDTFKIIVPGEFCAKVVEMSRDYPSKEIVLYVDESFVVATFEEKAYVFSKLKPEAESFSFSSIIESTGGDTAEFVTIPEDFTNAVDRSSILLNNEFDKMAKFTVQGDEVTLETSTGIGETKDVIAFENTLNIDKTFHANPDLLKKACNLTTEIGVTEAGLFLREGKFLHLIAVHDNE